MERVALAGLIALRWAALAWMGVVLALNHDDLRRPWLAVALVGAALVFTALASTWLHSAPDLLVRRDVLAAELAIATALVLGDGWAYGAGHAFSSSQSLGSIWPLAAILSIGLARGVGWGASAGVLLGLGRLGATLANGVRDFDGGRVVSLVNTAAFYAVAGAVAGYVTLLLHRAEREISTARAREELARDLHDGVLQTLAIVQRRSSDDDLVRLAREQDRDLRRFLFGATRLGGHAGDLATVLQSVAARFEDSFGVRAEVLVPFDLPKLSAERVDVIGRAVAEALTNAGKHASAQRLTVFVEPDDEGHIFCSVKDDGAGFDAAAIAPGVGIARSIVDRVQEAGGRAEVRSRPGQGTEVCLWL
ncbi:MAG: ATP-binding protein [Acidimicrobiales bacterium]